MSSTGCLHHGRMFFVKSFGNQFKITGITNAMDGSEINLVDESRPINDQEAVGEEAAALLFDYSDVEFLGFGEDQPDDHDDS